MRVGLVAEGNADLAVLANILYGVLRVEREQLHAIRPEAFLDETDLHARRPEHYSNWEIVRETCTSRDAIDAFLDSPIVFEGEDAHRIVVVQIDTAECHLYGVDARTRDDLLERVRSKVAEWLGGRLDGIVRAVAVEETDAWVLAIYVDGDTSRKLDAKGALKRYAQKALRLRGEPGVRDYAAWSRPLRKRKDRDLACTRNPSLAGFVADLESLAEKEG